MAYNNTSASNGTVLNKIISDIPGAGSTGYTRTDFQELSVAATNWSLTINSGQVNISELQDIELIFQHNSYTRPDIICPSN